MNPYIEQLYAIAQKKERLIIGLMSGTSLDGLDIALCRISGYGNETKAAVVQFKTIPYSAEEKQIIRTVCSKEAISLKQLTMINPWLAILHAKMINQSLGKWKIHSSDVDLIGSHGQTIYHAPKAQHKDDRFPNATLQIADGDHLAVHTGIICISDFRQKAVAMGGEGAPLAFIADEILFRHKTENRILLNIGGIANITWLPSADSGENLQTSDTGPGNILMDSFVQDKFPGEQFDTGGEIAGKGKVDPALHKLLMKHAFFTRPFPKTTGVEEFNLDFLKEILKSFPAISNEDILATLIEVTANSVQSAIENYTNGKHSSIYISGGGAKNATLVESLKTKLPGKRILDLHELGVNGDAKEALLFALLANEMIMNTGTEERPTMGKISLPA